MRKEQHLQEPGFLLFPRSESVDVEKS